MSGIEVSNLFNNSEELDRLRKKQEDVLIDINKIHKRLSQSTPEMVEKLGDNQLQKLREFYVQAKELAEKEMKISTSVLGQLDALLQSGLTAAQQKKIEVSEQRKKRMKADSDHQRVSPSSMRSQLELANTLIGEQVAARVTADHAEKDEWFIVKVMYFDRETKEFELLDEEPGDDEESLPRKYKLPMSRIIQFPKQTDPSSAPDFPTGRQVLAVYPGTTALYKATVVNPHRKEPFLSQLNIVFSPQSTGDGSSYNSFYGLSTSQNQNSHPVGRGHDYGSNNHGRGRNGCGCGNQNEDRSGGNFGSHG